MSLAPCPPATPQRPDAETTRLVRESCRTLAARETQLADLFARHLSTLGTPVAAVEAAELLHAMLDGVRSASDPAGTERHWQELGAQARFAVHAEGGFTRVGHALVRAVRDLSQDDWSAALSSGWMAFHVWMAGHLARGATSGPAAVRDRVATDWTYDDLLSARFGGSPQVAPAPKPR